VDLDIFIIGTQFSLIVEITTYCKEELNCAITGGKVNSFRIRVGKPEGKRPLGRPRMVD
jgi:hypothetical protein